MIDDGGGKGEIASIPDTCYDIKLLWNSELRSQHLSTGNGGFTG